MNTDERFAGLRAIAAGDVCRNSTGRYLYPPRTTSSEVLRQLHMEGLTYLVRDERGSVGLTATGQITLDAGPPPPAPETEVGEPYAPTQFVESNALLAVQIGDERSAWTHLEGLLDNELRSLANAASRLVDMAETLTESRAHGIAKEPVL